MLIDKKKKQAHITLEEGLPKEKRLYPKEQVII
jgi:hypothetical protein